MTFFKNNFFILLVNCILHVLVIQPSFATTVNCKDSFSLGTAGVESQVIEEVLRLEDKEKIPSSVFRKSSINQIARSIVERVRRQELILAREFKMEDHSKVNLFTESEIILFFFLKDFQSIYERGFLNQHLSGKSRGGYVPKERLRAEDNVTGILMGNSEKSLILRPKSAFLNVRSHTELAHKKHSITRQYGNIGAVLNSEMKKRSLWTASDSLCLGQKSYLNLQLDYSGESLFPHRGTFSRGALPSKSRCDSYYETLVYGSFNFSHVDYFLVESKEAVEVLKVLGKPVYLIKSSSKYGRVIFSRGELLFRGTSEP
ncbi:MAG: hypothetical protein CL678_18615 [Bdellovibrionaceae bacterium]|nr:hypothetical protein [Pseudobdellovibrionaceae bacterium]